MKNFHRLLPYLPFIVLAIATLIAIDHLYS